MQQVFLDQNNPVLDDTELTRFVLPSTQYFSLPHAPSVTASPVVITHRSYLFHHGRNMHVNVQNVGRIIILTKRAKTDLDNELTESHAGVATISNSSDLISLRPHMVLLPRRYAGSFFRTNHLHWISLTMLSTYPCASHVQPFEF